MVHEPEVRNVTAEPETVQTAGVLEAKLTGCMELAVAVKLSGVPTCWAVMVPKVMVCDLSAAAVTVIGCVAASAAAKVLLPPCEAVTEQVPASTNVTVLPDNVQAPVGDAVKA